MQTLRPQKSMEALTNNCRLQILQNNRRKRSFLTSSCALCEYFTTSAHFEEWICQRWRQLQTLASLNRGRHLDKAQQSKGTQEASRMFLYLKLGNKYSNKGLLLHRGTWLVVSGYPNLEGRSTADNAPLKGNYTNSTKFYFSFPQQTNEVHPHHEVSLTQTSIMGSHKAILNLAF